MIYSLTNEIFSEYKTKLNPLAICYAQENYSDSLGSFIWVSSIWITFKNLKKWIACELRAYSLHLKDDEQVFNTLT